MDYDKEEVKNFGRKAFLHDFITNKTDYEFKKLCAKILLEGSSTEGTPVRPKWKDDTPAHTIRTFGNVAEYDLSESFPILTLRPVPLKTAIDEILWIWSKKSNNVHDLNSHIWNQWCDVDGSIGKAYGYQLGIKHKYPEGEFDQVDRVLYDLKHNPTSRRIMTNLYNHADLHEMGLYPCAYGMTFSVIDGTLSAMLNQRSQDVFVANGFNVSQYAALVMMFAQVSGLKPGKLIHVIADAHIYDRHIPMIMEMLRREPTPAPTLKINSDIKNFYDFTVDDFELVGYNPHQQFKNIEVAE